jgi:hypothetical protein
MRCTIVMGCTLILAPLLWAQHGLPKARMTVEMTGPNIVDARGMEHALITGADGKLYSKEVPKSTVPLPVLVKFERRGDAPLELSSRDYTFAILDAQGTVLPARTMIPYESDPKTGLPAGPAVRTISLKEKTATDDPKLSLSIDDIVRKSRLKSGRYTLVVHHGGEIATCSFQLKCD